MFNNEHSCGKNMVKLLQCSLAGHKDIQGHSNPETQCCYTAWTSLLQRNITCLDIFRQYKRVKSTRLQIHCLHTWLEFCICQNEQITPACFKLKTVRSDFRVR